MGHKRYSYGRFAEHREAAAIFELTNIVTYLLSHLGGVRQEPSLQPLYIPLDPISAFLTSVLGCVLSLMTKGSNFSMIFMPPRLETTRMDVVSIHPCELQSMPVDPITFLLSSTLHSSSLSCCLIVGFKIQDQMQR